LEDCLSNPFVPLHKIFKPRTEYFLRLTSGQLSTIATELKKRFNEEYVCYQVPSMFSILVQAVNKKTSSKCALNQSININ